MKDDRFIQSVNADILGMRDLFYANIIGQNEFLKVFDDYNKKYDIDMSIEHKKDNGHNMRYYVGYIGQQNIYNISVYEYMLKD